jgi:hypothetical protein
VATLCCALLLPLLAACSITVQGDSNPTAAPTAAAAAPTSAASGAPAATATTAVASVAPSVVVATAVSPAAPSAAATTTTAPAVVATATRTTAASAAPTTQAATATRTGGPAVGTRVSGSPTSAPIPTVPPVAAASPTAAPSSYGGVVRGDAICFPDKTDYCIAGRFRQYWEQNGSLPINGYPLSDEFTQTLEDGKPYTVQYFERVRMEYHPENPAPYNVLLGRLTADLVPAAQR